MSVEKLLEDFGPDKHVHAVVVKEVSESNHAEWCSAAAEFATQTRAEPGCVRFQYLRVKGSSPARFMLCEEWESLDALKAHFKTDHFARLVPVCCLHDLLFVFL